MNNEKLILLGHGSGGRLSAELMATVVQPRLSNPVLDELGDSAVLDFPGGRLAFTTDSYVVDPIFFPGGDIGDLAVNGTVNDLAMAGADPLYLTLGMILEEGLPIADLERVLDSVKRCAAKAGVRIVAGDTKVVPRGKADRMFLNTSGVGLVPDGFVSSPGRIRTGDCLILSGTVGDHGVAVLSQRAGIGFACEAKSDTAALNRMAASLRVLGDRVHFMRDPTRGGLAATLNEACRGAAFGVEIREADIPIDRPVKAACDLLGLDPLHVANEGKMVAVVEAGSAAWALELMRSFPEGASACIIGHTVSSRPGTVVSITRSGGRRIVDLPAGEILPRIC
ncbi:MAG: hydrogenase expression/formation protein HypE [Myxococcota bacterium]|jgi:hydrogenase expression/formation protein HypE